MSKEEIKILIYKYYLAKTIEDIIDVLTNPKFIEKLKLLSEICKGEQEWK